VVVHNILADERLSSGGPGGPRRFFEDVLLTEVLEVFSFLSLLRALPLGRSPDVETRGERSKFMEGKTSFFCFDAGRISSRSTGTPNETRKSRRIRERNQLGGCNGGGATSCDHNERLRSVRKTDESAGKGSIGALGVALSIGKRSFMYIWDAAIISSGPSNSSKSSTGYQGCMSVSFYSN
jgi:hypothetical protein